MSLPRQVDQHVICKFIRGLACAFLIEYLVVFYVPNCQANVSTSGDQPAVYVDKRGTITTPLNATARDRWSLAQHAQQFNTERNGMVHGSQRSYSVSRMEEQRRQLSSNSTTASELHSKESSTRLSRLYNPAYLARERRRIRNHAQERTHRYNSAGNHLRDPCQELTIHKNDRITPSLSASSPQLCPRNSTSPKRARSLKLSSESDFHQSSPLLFPNHLMWQKGRKHWLSPGRVQEILNFISHFLKRYRTFFDPTQLYVAIYEWELEEHKKHLLTQREQVLHGRHWKREKIRLRDYNRKLRYFALMRTREKVKRFNKARTYDDFHSLLFGEAENHANNKPRYDDHQQMPVDSSTGSRLRRSFPEHPSVVASSTNYLHLPGGAGGGVFVKTPRYLREIAVNDEPEKDLIPSEQHIADISDGQVALQDTVDEEPAHSEAELRSAFESYQEFKQTACQPRNQTVCGSSLLDLSQHHTNLLIPHGFHIQRCGDQIPHGTCNMHQNVRNFPADLDYLNEHDLAEYIIEMEPRRSCNCEMPEEECLPTKVALKTQAVVIIQNQSPNAAKHSTELLVLTNHISCGCMPRCLNRQCIHPLRFIMQTISDCSCVCLPGDQRCLDLLKGKQAFTETEIPLPLNGSFILPPCLYGVMDEASLYHRRCPPKPVASSITST